MATSAFNPHLQQVLDAFRHKPGVTPQHYQNLVNCITQTPVLLHDMNQSALGNRLKHIETVTGNTDFAGAYNGLPQTIRLPLNSLDFASMSISEEAAKLEIITTLGHEIKHSFNFTERQQERQLFQTQIQTLAQSGQPVIDYTAPLMAAQQGDIKDEARSELAAWNAAVSYLQNKHPQQPITLQEIYVNYDRATDFIDFSEVNNIPHYTMHQGFILQLDKNMHIDNPSNIQAMQRDYFDGDINRQESYSMGHHRNSDYRNKYAAAKLEKVVETHLTYAPNAKMMLDMQRLGWSEQLIEQNGLIVPTPSHQMPYRDAHTPQIERYFDHTFQPENPGPSQRSIRMPLSTCPTAMQTLTATRFCRLPQLGRTKVGLQRALRRMSASAPSVSESAILMQHPNAHIVKFHEQIQNEPSLTAYSETDKSRIAAAACLEVQKRGFDFASLGDLECYENKGRQLFGVEDMGKHAKNPYTSFATVDIEEAVQTPCARQSDADAKRANRPSTGAATQPAAGQRDLPINSAAQAVPQQCSKSGCRGQCGQGFVNICCQLFGRRLRRKAFNDLAVAPDEELGEIPLHGLAAEQAGGLLLEPVEQRLGLRAVDVDLAHHRKIHAVVQAAKPGNFFVAASVLVAKLVARKTQHHQPLVGVLCVQFLQTGKLWRKAAGTGGVDDQQHLAPVLREWIGVALDVGDLKVVSGGGGRWHAGS